MSTIKIARRVTMRVARNLLSEHFNDPTHRSMYEAGKHIWRDEQARIEAERRLDDEYLAEIQEHHSTLDEVSRPASDEVMPKGNLEVAKGVSWVVVPDNYLDGEGNPVAVRQPHMKDNRPEHVYMDNWMAHSTYHLRISTSEGDTNAVLRFGYTNDDIETRVLGYKVDGRTQQVVPEGFPPVGASWSEVLAWVGEDETVKRAMWVGQRRSIHLPDYEFMTEEQRHTADSYNPWKTKLSYMDRMALTPSPTDQEHYPEHFEELYKDDHWH